MLLKRAISIPAELLLHWERMHMCSEKYCGLPVIGKKRETLVYCGINTLNSLTWNVYLNISAQQKIQDGKNK